MNPEQIRLLYTYQSWANRRILDTAAALTPAQLLANHGASFGSIHDTLVHTMAGQWIWLSRWQGQSPTNMFVPADFSDLVAIRARWEAIEADTRRFVAALDEAALAQTIHYRNTSGQPFAFPLWQLMLHQANHATQHRSEIALLLTGLGHSPGDLDLIKYLIDGPVDLAR